MLILEFLSPSLGFLSLDCLATVKKQQKNPKILYIQSWHSLQVWAYYNYAEQLFHSKIPNTTKDFQF